MTFKFGLVFSALMFSLVLPARAEVDNWKVVINASLDYSDTDSLIHNITSKGKTTETKLWLLFEGNHIARRQTEPMNVHGMALTDPIRQFNDCGFTMCSTISGINCSTWDVMYCEIVRDIRDSTFKTLQVTFNRSEKQDAYALVERSHTHSKPVIETGAVLAQNPAPNLTAPNLTAPTSRNNAKPNGEPVLEPSALHSLGAYWIISGDDNQNAQVQFAFRKSGATEWQNAMPLLRVMKGDHLNQAGQSKLNVPSDAWLFAGSALQLQPNTAYEIKLHLLDPDGGSAEKVFASRTRAEPKLSVKSTPFHVVPGNGGGDGSQANPFKGLNAAQEKAKAGDVFLLHGGIYEGTFIVNKSGEENNPIVWRGAGDGEAILDGQGKAQKRPGRAISATDIHDVWFENITVRHADYAFVGHNSARLVIRGCKIKDAEFGITCTNNQKDTVNGWFIADNIIEGPSTWPRSKGIEDARGIQVTGTGHEICYNRIHGFGDAIDTFGSQRCASIDIHHNEISECTDDGIEADYSERNVRVFANRLTNVFQGISTQPLFGGPVYIFRNVLYNVGMEPFKMHNAPSGVLIMHNTVVKKGMPLVLYSNAPVKNCFYRNNLFIGTDGGYAYESTAPMQKCDFDYDGFGGGPYEKFLKWNGTRYNSIKEAQAKAPVYKHAVAIDNANLFESKTLPPADEKTQFPIGLDLRLKNGSAAINSGARLPGLNDDFKGNAPDLGAYELGEALPHYGPR